MTNMIYSQLEKSWMDSRVSPELITLLIHQIGKIVPLPSHCSTRPIKYNRPTAHSNVTDPTAIPALEEFIDLLTRRSRTRTGTVLVALILLTRLSQRLGLVATTGLDSAPQRIFLASLIISTKLIHDTSPKNKHWLTFANGYFELDEINLMEKQFLTLMDFNLMVSDYEFAQAVDRYQQLQKDRCLSNININININTTITHFSRSGNTNRKRTTKTRRWQDSTPDCLVSPNRNVALAGKNATVTRRSLPTSSSTSSLVSALSASSSSSSSSSLMTLSLSSTPVFDPLLSHSTSSSSCNSHSLESPLKPIRWNDSRLCDTDLNKAWCYPTKCKSPLFSV